MGENGGPVNANYDLRALIADVTEVVRDTQDDDARCERITPYLRTQE